MVVSLCLSSISFLTDQKRSIGRENDDITTCNAWLKIARTKKWFEFCNDNCPDLKIGRCSTGQRKARVRHESLGDDTSETARKALIEQVIAVGACKFPTL